MKIIPQVCSKFSAAFFSNHSIISYTASVSYTATDLLHCQSPKPSINSKIRKFKIWITFESLLPLFSISPQIPLVFSSQFTYKHIYFYFPIFTIWILSPGLFWSPANGHLPFKLAHPPLATASYSHVMIFLKYNFHHVTFLISFFLHLIFISSIVYLSNLLFN